MRRIHLWRPPSSSSGGPGACGELATGVFEKAIADYARAVELKQALGGIYEGVRVQLAATLERARIPVQIDIGFGDVITPGTQTIQYPSMLGFPTPLVFTYPRETVVAEKLQAMVLLGMANSRMKDFFDLWVLAERFAFDGGVLVQAVQATFERRRTLLPEAMPTALTDAFHQDASKRKQWKAFISKGGLTETPSMPSIMAALRNFLLPLIEAASSNEPLRKQWTPGGPWRHSNGET